MRDIDHAGIRREREPVANSNMQRALAYIHQHYSESIKLESAAAEANMSASHFCRMFKEVRGVGFVDYLNKLRVKRACEMLATTRRPVSTIGYECGFANLSNFNRNFRKPCAQGAVRVPCRGGLTLCLRRAASGEWMPLLHEGTSQEALQRLSPPDPCRPAGCPHSLR